jgi:(2Fe-2S) ferredoxin
VLLIWPEGIVYGGVSPERVEQILREHVIGGTPIEPWIVKRMPFRAAAANEQPD